MTYTEILVAQNTQRDLPVTDKPFRAVAQATGLTEAEVLNTLQTLRHDGILRKFGAILKHQRVGYSQNALIVWAASPDDLDRTGSRFAALPFVSHCYTREPAFLNRYNLFTMVHARHQTLDGAISEMTKVTGSRDYLILESLEEYKKTSPEYF